jgi:hypothetical protein
MVEDEVMSGGDHRGFDGDDEGEEIPLSGVKVEINLAPKSLFLMVTTP